MTRAPKAKKAATVEAADLAAYHFGPTYTGDFNAGPSNEEWLNYIAFIRAAWATLDMSDEEMAANARGKPNAAEELMQTAEDFNSIRHKLESAVEFLKAGSCRCMVVAARLDLERKAS